MSPEPTQEPVDNLNTSNVNLGAITVHESDSEEEDAEMAGYMPLSQIPIEGEPLEEDDEDSEWDWNPQESEQIYSLPNNEAEPSVPSETLQVWSSACNSSHIDLDADKINQVKSAMASFKLPSTAIPEWANSITEDEWKEKLIHCIKEIQEGKK